jgi:hypothetical protein
MFVRSFDYFAQKRFKREAFDKATYFAQKRFKREERE